MQTLKKAEAGQVETAAAAIYDRAFVPALFGQFAPMLADAAAIAPGEHVLDVGCGTGVAALAAAERIGPEGHVTAVDINPGMLAVARSKSDAIEWIEAPAESLPLADGQFDAVMCQFALMFFADRTAALREMARVTKPGGRIALLVWEVLDRTPAYDRLVPLVGEIAGPDAAAALAAPFSLGSIGDIKDEIDRAGLKLAEHGVLTGTARHASLDAWIDTEIGGWTLSDMVSAEPLRRLKAAARHDLAAHIGANGRVAFPAPARLVMIRP
ncbi:methyltransferase domain-containing protein [Defluviimonas sp. WL0024]|uniref:Methyltransferase domain-containing protein n=1 Tax=Albidovulum salinarum TaxID=2984153 RepID=A0ABT2X8X3_9RHOB|nr:methyltransferase domain-containing protein [Defluviimonas sp. WL0024]MCU9850397.1 methyltransferase domain-containing protein [Defluviimonas sp. WL0024]